MSKKPKPESPSIEMLAPETLRAREVNPRVHPPAQLEALARSMREFGFTSPVLIDGEGVIIAGHGRVAAAIHAKLGPVPCIRVRHLTPEQVRAYVIADNRLAGLAEWDEDMLRTQLSELSTIGFDCAAVGFDSSELEKLIGAFDASGTDMPELPSGDRAPFQQKTFTLHDEQAEEVDAAIDKAKGLGHGQSGVNENSNGNALAFVCQWFNRQEVKP